MTSQPTVNNYTSSSATELYSGSNCINDFGGLVLPNVTDSNRVCALRSTNATLMQSCCGNAALQAYGCWLFCSSIQSLQTFATCINDTDSRSNVNSTVGGFALDALLCQGSLESNNTATLSSSAHRTLSAPRISWVALALVFAVLFIDPSAALIVPSLAGTAALTRRASGNSDCSFNMDKNYTSLGRSVVVSDEFATRGQFFSLQVDTGINNNNRTINGTSAADAKYDAFFEVISNATDGRLFPAQSSVELMYDLATDSNVWYLGWTPYLWCTNGTISNCSGVLGDSDATTFVDVCGPVFVGDAKSLNDTAASIQGTFIPVALG